MKYLKKFEHYDSPDVPKISGEEIADMTNIRPYHNKFQPGFYHKGSADLNISIHNLTDQEKQDIMTVLHNVSKKYFKNLDILDIRPEFNWIRGETAHLKYRLTKEIPTENFGNLRINIEYSLSHNYTGEKIKGLEEFEELKNTSGVFISCSVKSNFSKNKDFRSLMKTIFKDDKEKGEEASAIFRVGKEDYTEKEINIRKEEEEMNKKFFYKNKNIKSEDIEMEIDICGDIYNKFLNYIDSVYDITIKDLKDEKYKTF